MLIAVNVKNQLYNVYFGDKNREAYYKASREIKWHEDLYILDLDDGIVETIKARDMLSLVVSGIIDLPYGLVRTNTGDYNGLLEVSTCTAFSKMFLPSINIADYSLSCANFKCTLNRGSNTIFNIRIDYFSVLNKLVVIINNSELMFGGSNSSFKTYVGFEWYYSYKKGDLLISRFIVYKADNVATLTIIVKDDNIVGIDIVDCEKIKLVSYSKSLESLLNSSYATKLKILKLKY